MKPQTPSQQYFKKSKNKKINACDQCDYKAILKQQLKIHRQSNHDQVKYNCDQCDYKTTNRSSLNFQKQSKHEGIMYDELCDHRGYKAAGKDILKKHK